MLPLPDNFRFLNREGLWLDFHWSGLERAPDGALQLLPSPLLVDSPPPDLQQAPAPLAPSGIAVDPTGRIFFSVPEQNQIVSTGGCSNEMTPLLRLAEAGGLAPLLAPRGLLILNDPERLVVADSGNHRVLFFDTATLELIDVWGPDDVAATPSPDSAPGGFNTPWSVAQDAGGSLYVLDYGNRRVQKFRPTAEVEQTFSNNVAAIASRPGALAAEGGNVFVFDQDANVVYVFDAQGMPLRDEDGDVLAIVPPGGFSGVVALAASPDALYAGDNGSRHVFSFRRLEKFAFAGEATGFEGPIAALAIDSAGAVLVCCGGTLAPLHLSSSGAFAPFGSLWSGAISAGNSAVNWNRLRAAVQNVPGGHIEFFFSTSNTAAAPPVDPGSANPFQDPRWTALPNDVEDFLLGTQRAQYLFAGAIFSGDRSGTPRLTQMRADFNDQGYLPYLPAIYQQPPGNDYLRRFVALFQGLFDDIEGELDSLPKYFDSRSVPLEALPWLAGWLAVDLDQGEPAARIRANIAGAFARYQWNGTVKGLKQTLLDEAGVHANIVEPIANTSVWAFPGDTSCSGVPSTPTGVTLGSTSGLTGMQPGGAVLGSTAELDHSYLITDAQFGEPLFEGSAYQFVVEVYSSEVGTDARRALVQEIVEREKPAHTMWRLVILEPSMRSGFQARVGIDSIVAGTPGPSGLGVPDNAAGLRLAGTPLPRIGASRLGENLKL